MRALVHVVHWPVSGIGVFVRALALHGRQNGLTEKLVVLEHDTIADRRLVDSFGADATVASLSNAPVSALSRATRTLRSASIIHSHSFTPMLLALLVRPMARHVRTIHNNYPYFHTNDLRSILKRWIEFAAIRLFGVNVACVSSDVLGALPKRLSRTGQVWVIENGIDLQALDQAKPTLRPLRNDGRVVFVAVGRLERQKGIDVLIDAFATLQTRAASSARPELWIVGDGSLRNALQCQTEQLGLSNVRFFGNVSPAFDIVRSADVFVMPSRHEGFPLAALEAMALGLPTILAEFGGIAGRVTRDHHAMVVPREDAAALASAMAKLLGDSESRDRLGQAGRSFVRAEFAIDRCIEQYSTLYELE